MLSGSLMEGGDETASVRAIVAAAWQTWALSPKRDATAIDRDSTRLAIGG
jgi:hypothetical protein